MHTATPAQLHWLEGELRAWRAEGLLDEATTVAIRSRYVANRRFTLSRIVLTLGASFVGLGLIWLVIGVVYLAYLTRLFRLPPPEMEFTEDEPAPPAHVS